MAAEEFTQSELDSFLTELTATRLPLETKGGEDPFYHAQVLQSELTAASKAIEITSGDSEHIELNKLNNVSVQKMMGDRAIEVLNTKFSPEIRNKRLALSTAHLLAVYRHERPRGPLLEGDVIVSGIFDRFYFSPITNDGEEALVAVLTRPRFIDPDFIDTSEYKGVVIPVMDVTDWNPHSLIY